MTRARGERGMVTVETGFAALFLALAAGLAIVVAGALFVFGQCQVTANEVARQLSRGDERAAARASEDAPAGAVVTSAREGGAAVVRVRWTAKLGTFTWPLEAQARVLEER
ncbi:MAG: hypothetical protein QM708_09890 [Propioniciclava sp.]|uniref:hypothetical protein n=1 Tax=Propioniciclava sp. TaxID=2038686 RepID=UPI0039E2C565